MGWHARGVLRTRLRDIHAREVHTYKVHVYKMHVYEVRAVKKVILFHITVDAADVAYTHF